MKFVLLLFIAIVKIETIRSDAASILIDLGTIIEEFNAIIETEKDDMITIYLNEGLIFAKGNDYLLTNFVNRLRRLNGINIWSARQLNGIYVKNKLLLDAYFSFTPLKQSFNGDFQSIQDVLGLMITSNVTEFTQVTNDAAKLDTCWSAQRTNLVQFFTDLSTMLIANFDGGPGNIAATVNGYEVERSAYFVQHESTFPTCRFEWNCIGRYVRHFFW